MSRVCHRAVYDSRLSLCIVEKSGLIYNYLNLTVENLKLDISC